MLIKVFFFNDTATSEIYTLSLHDALPICRSHRNHGRSRDERQKLHHSPPEDISAGYMPAPSKLGQRTNRPRRALDRKSTRLNSSHANISYAVFCLKKK